MSPSKAPMIGRTCPVGPGGRRDPVSKCPPGQARRAERRAAKRAEQRMVRVYVGPFLGVAA